MTSRFRTHPKLNVRVKILIIFLTLSIISLLIMGFVAFFTISSVGNYAEQSSSSLGMEAVNDSSTALMRSAEENLVRVASDQAAITDILFVDTEAEIEILAAHAAVLQNASPQNLTVPWYLKGEPSPDQIGALPVIFAPGTSVTPQSDEFHALSGMDTLLKAVKQVDPDLTSIYVATDSGVMWMYPMNEYTPPDYDPRTREWFIRATRSDQPVWSDPYVDAAGQGLIITCSRSMPSKRYGNWVIGTDVTIDAVNTQILNILLEGQGYPVLLDSKGNVISRPGLTANGTTWDETFKADNAFSSDNPDLVAVAINMTAGKTGIERVRFNGSESYVAYAPVKSLNWSFAVSMPVEEIVAPVKKTEAKISAATRTTGMHIDEQTGRIRDIFAGLFCLLLIVVILLAVYLARIITRPVDALKHGTTVLGAGNLDYRMELRTGDEFEDLANSINQMASDLKTNIENLRLTTAEKERYTKELEIAKEIQESFLPESTPEIPGFEIAAVTIPAMEIGGDLYDFIPVKGDRWGFVIADVSGKGVSAALFMALSRTLIHASGESEADPSIAIQQANRSIYENGRSSMFITVFYGVLDPMKRTFSYVNAGHNPPLLVRGVLLEVHALLKSKGIALGVVEDVDIPCTVLDLLSGDLIILYTDGVTEAFNEHDEDFSEERLREFVRANRALPPQEIMDRLINEIRKFTGAAPQSDDITLVVIKVK